MASSWRWLIVLVLAIAIGTAVWDAVAGSWGSAVSSAVYAFIGSRSETPVLIDTTQEIERDEDGTYVIRLD